MGNRSSSFTSWFHPSPSSSSDNEEKETQARSNEAEVQEETPGDIPTLEQATTPIMTTSSVSSYNVLLDLPYPVDQYILNDWLEIHDLAYLDMAFTNHTLRPAFIQLLSQRSCRSLQLEQINLPRLYSNYLDWLLSRQIFIKLLALDRKNWKYLVSSVTNNNDAANSRSGRNSNLMNSSSSSPPSNTSPGIAVASRWKYTPLLQKIEILGIGCTNAENNKQFPVRTLEHCPNLYALILINIQDFSNIRYSYMPSPVMRRNKRKDEALEVETENKKKGRRRSRRHYMTSSEENEEDQNEALNKNLPGTTSFSPSASTLFPSSTNTTLMPHLEIKQIQTEKGFFHFHKLKAISILNTSLPHHMFNLLLYHATALQGMMLNNSTLHFKIPMTFTQFIDNECCLTQMILKRLKFLQILKCSNLSFLSLVFLLQSCTHLEYIKIQKEHGGSLFSHHGEGDIGGGGGGAAPADNAFFPFPFNANDNNEDDGNIVMEGIDAVDGDEALGDNNANVNQNEAEDDGLTTAQQANHLLRQFLQFATDVLNNLHDREYTPSIETSPIFHPQQLQMINAFHQHASLFPESDDRGDGFETEQMMLIATHQSPLNHSSSNQGNPMFSSSSSNIHLIPASPLTHPFFPTFTLLNCPLKTLDLEGMNELKDTELILLLHGVCSTVQEINLNFCHEIGNKSLIYIGQRCVKLKILMLSYCYLITDEGMKQFSYYFQQHLNITRTHSNSSSSTLRQRSASFAAPFSNSLSSSLFGPGTVRNRSASFSAASSFTSPMKPASNPQSTSEFSLPTPPHKGLEILHLYGCHQLTDASLKALIPVVKDSLTHISISECVFITDEGIIPFFQACQQLEKLCMNRSEVCHRIHDETIQSMYTSIENQKKLNKMKTLLFANLIHFTTKSYCQLFSFCLNLLILDLSKNYYTVTDEVIEVISINCNKLKNIDIHYCTSITNHGLIMMSQRLQQLMELNIKGNSLVTIDGIMAILKNCSNIQKVDASYCAIDENDLQEILLQTKAWNQDYIFYRRTKPNQI